MPAKTTNVSEANHSPDELLESAEFLLSLNNPKAMRGAILEAITALEAYVHDTVFATLSDKIDLLLVEWLEDKTRMDFDSRLSVLTPVATGLTINKQSDLWENYKKARNIRKKVAHSGAKVTVAEARFVINTVYEWLDYLSNSQKTRVERPERESTSEVLSRFLELSARLERLLYNILVAIKVNGHHVHDREAECVNDLRHEISEFSHSWE